MPSFRRCTSFIRSNIGILIFLFAIVGLYLRNRSGKRTAHVVSSSLSADDLTRLLRHPNITEPGFVFRHEKVFVCPLYKNLHIPLLALLCKKASEMDDSIQLDFKKIDGPAFSIGLMSYCLPKLTRYSKTRDKGIWQDEAWKKIVVVREPFERFVSIWNYACNHAVVPQRFANKKTDKSCYGCKTDLACFIEAQHEHYMAMMKSQKLKVAFEGDSAFYPQSWHCDLTTQSKSYTSKILHSKDETFGEELRRAFTEAGFDSAVNDGWGNSGGEVFLADYRQSTVDDATRDEFYGLMANSPQHANFLFKIYFTDFYHFGIEVPEFVRDACAEENLDGQNEEGDDDASPQSMEMCKWQPEVPLSNTH